ncbi:ComF family protein [Bacillus sp. FJAT-50079]|uniref:ComF family protein n=1 Tax=Bacillus sp. FJAT-50079 TaxID=2833577 RepID=UPI001BCA030C|nr:ComF family protein [Bacillus sp. FJAT-50079]MBS4208276.1 ComF family protein [Bacillus sp. FJAT-50079]
MNAYCLYCQALILDEMTWTKLFFPREQSPLCSSCFGKLKRLKEPCCKKCSRSLNESAYMKEAHCIDCVRWEQQSQWKGILKRNTSLYEYNDFMKEMIARYKFRGDYALAKAFFMEIRMTVQKLEYDFLIPIPLSEERLKERGFNQATALVHEAGFPTVDILRRHDSEKQSKKTRRSRIEQARIFSIVENADIANKNVLLIDDIYTTGATIYHAAKTLKEVGAASIQSFTLVRS